MNNTVAKTEGEEISLRDIFNFIKRNQLRFFLCGFAGILLALIYLYLSPKEYEARFQLQMAQISSNVGEASNSEDASSLIHRLRVPTTYSEKATQACAMSEREFGDYLGGMLAVSPIKGMPNAVEMKVRASSREIAKHCAEGLVFLIRDQQRALIEEKLAGRQLQLEKYQQAMKEEQRQLERIGSATQANFAYLATLGKISWLRSRIDILQEEALLAQMHPTKLVSPIYIPSKSVAPKEKLALILGLMLGVLIGVLYSIARERWE